MEYDIIPKVLFSGAQLVECAETEKMFEVVSDKRFPDVRNRTMWDAIEVLEDRVDEDQMVLIFKNVHTHQIKPLDNYIKKLFS